MNRTDARRPAGLAALLAAVALATPCAAAPSLDECDAMLEAGSRDRAFYVCVDRYFDPGVPRESVVARVESLLDERPGDPRAELALASLLFNLERRRSLELLDAAATGFAAEGLLEGEARTRVLLAQQLRRYLRLDEAEAQARRAADVARELDEVSLTSVVMTTQAANAEFRGDYGRAWMLYRRLAVDPAFAEAKYEYRVNTLVHLAEVAQPLGRLEEARDTYVEIAALCRAAGDIAGEAGAVSEGANVVGLLAERDGDSPDEAAALARHGLELALESRNLVAEMTARLVLGRHAPLAEALEQLDRLDGTSRRFACWDVAMDAERTRALRLLADDPASAERSFRAIGAILDEAAERGDGESYVETLKALAEARLSTGPHERAVAESLAAIEAIESFRALQSGDELRADVFANWSDIYYRLIDELLAGGDAGDGDLELAFGVAERLRARALLDHLEMAGAGGPTLDAATSATLGDLQRRIARVQLELAEPGLSAARRDDAGRRLERLELDESVARSERAGPEPEFATSATVRRELRPDEALIDFLTAPRGVGSWAIVVTSGGMRVYALPDRGRLDPAVRIWTGLLANRDRSEKLGVDRLYDDLLRPALDELPPAVTRLIVVPDGPLHRLPIGALRPSAGALPLTLSYEISLAPSATVWLKLRREAPAAAGAMRPLILADPSVRRAGDSAVQWRGADDEPLPLPPLRHARAEARAVRDALGGGRLLVGAEASEAGLKALDLSDYGVVHFAAHALVDEDNPSRSAIVLAPGGPDEDGLLQIRELDDLHFSGQVVTLSACRTAGGNVLAGEGVMSLARSFLRSGARAVVATVFPLRDDEAAETVSAFYRHLAAGRSVAGALTAARREMIDAGAPTAAWAGLVVVGDGDAVPCPAVARETGSAAVGARGTTLLALAGAILGLGVAVRVARRIPRRPA